MFSLLILLSQLFVQASPEVSRSIVPEERIEHFSSELQPFQEPRSLIAAHHSRDSAPKDLFLSHEEQELIATWRAFRFPNWDPLKKDSTIDVLVIDTERIGHDFVEIHDLEGRLAAPEWYYFHGREIGEMFTSAFPDLVEVEHRTVKLSAEHCLQQSFSAEDLLNNGQVANAPCADFVEVLRSINDEIEAGTLNPDMVNISLSRDIPFSGSYVNLLGEIDAYSDYWGQRNAVVEYYGAQRIGLMTELSRLASLVDGPVLLAAGNQSADSYNLLGVALLWSHNMVVVGATEANGEVADYSSQTPHVHLYGDIRRTPVCSADGLVGVKTEPGGHVFMFKDHLVSFRYVEGKSIQSVTATSEDFRQLKEAIRARYLSYADTNLEKVLFSWEEVDELRSSAVSTKVKSRLLELRLLMKGYDVYVDSETLFKFASPSLSDYQVLDGMTGTYFVDYRGKVRISQVSCAQIEERLGAGTSYSAPRGGIGIIKDYLEERNQ